ncbi:hypothetical protein VYU27_009358, partial [Nannochloropsis oceanica]
MSGERVAKKAKGSTATVVTAATVPASAAASSPGASVATEMVDDPDDDERTITQRTQSPGQQKEAGAGEDMAPTLSSFSTSSGPSFASGVAAAVAAAAGLVPIKRPLRSRSVVGGNGGGNGMKVKTEEEEEEKKEKEEEEEKEEQTEEETSTKANASSRSQEKGKGKVRAEEGKNGGGRGGAGGGRKESMRRVAESRAAFFARADAGDRAVPQAMSGGGLEERGGSGQVGRSVRSSMPLPALEEKKKKRTKRKKEEGGKKGGREGEEKEEWCGPFATARKIMREREAAREAREARLEAGGGSSEEESSSEEEEVGEGGGGNKKKRKEKKKVVVEWTPMVRKTRPGVWHQPLSLSAQCLAFLLDHVDELEGLGEVSTQ